MGTIALTGSASGMGATTRARLEDAGHRVVGVDLRDAEVLADLGTPDGRAAAVAATADAAGDTLDGLATFAGLGPAHASPATVVAVNYFGAVAVLDGLFPVLTAGTAPAAVAISSNSATAGIVDDALVAACLAGDEVDARRLAEELPTATAYASSKLALARWVRRQVQRWGEAGVRLNAIAPGPVPTPMLDDILADPVLGEFTRAYPIPLGRMGTQDEVAAATAFLLGPESAWVHGAVLFVDGGTDALVNPDVV